MEVLRNTLRLPAQMTSISIVLIRLIASQYCQQRTMAAVQAQTRLGHRRQAVNASQPRSISIIKWNTKTLWCVNIWSLNSARTSNRITRTLLRTTSLAKWLAREHMPPFAWSWTKETRANTRWKYMKRRSCRTPWRRKLANARYSV